MPRGNDQPHKPTRTCRKQVLRVTVLCGGPSAEREISLDSGRTVAEALRRRGHDVFVADIDPEHLGALDHPADVIFPALHGTFGEDGTVQRLMEERKIPFVGTGSSASAICMDKVATKQAVLDAGLATPPFEVWTAETGGVRALPGVELPVVVKPVDQGSSVATTLVREPKEFRPAVQRAIDGFDRALIERFIEGDELTVGIVGPLTLPVICIRPKQPFYDYAAKYQDDATEYLFDTGHPDALHQQVQEHSRALFDALGCRHLARIDWIVDHDGCPWFLEVNTLPGFTSHSLVPKAAERVGISFDELVERLVRLAWRGAT